MACGMSNQGESVHGGGSLSGVVAGSALLITIILAAILAVQTPVRADPLALTPTAFDYWPYVAAGRVSSTPTPTNTATATRTRTRTNTPTPTNTRTPTSTFTPTPECPVTSGNGYSVGIAYQRDTDNPVRPAYNHADKNLGLRSYGPTAGPLRELVNYGSDDPAQPPQLAQVFTPNRVPPVLNLYRVNNWNWAPSPNPGTRGAPITTWQVTALGLSTAPGGRLTRL